MKQEEIIEYNKRCAEFLGMNNDAFLLAKQIEKNTGLCHLTFHSDWNLIHEVMGTIKNTTNPKEHSDTTFSTLRREIQTHLGRSNKEAVIEAINQFLIWYDKNK